MVPQEAIRIICSRDAMRRHVCGIMLNTCYSLPLAKELVQSFDFAIGTPDAVFNQAAVRFPAAFYAGLARGEHLQDAFRAGEAEFTLKQVNNRPQLHVPPGLDPLGYRVRLQAPDKPHLYIHHNSAEPSDCNMLKELRDQLHPLEAYLEIWDRSQISGGQTRTEAITQHLEQADLILLLVSPAALANDEWNTIKERACQRQQARSARVLPVMLRACFSEPGFFGGVDPINRNNRPIAGLSEAQRAESWLAVAQRLHRECGEIKTLYKEERVREQQINQKLAEQRMLKQPASASAPLQPVSPPPPPASVNQIELPAGQPAQQNISATSITRPKLRARLFHILRTDSDLDAFLVDYFPDVKRNLSSGMTRDAKVSLLFEAKDLDQITAALAAARPET